MFRLRNLAMLTPSFLHQSKASTVSLSQLASPIHGNISRALDGTPSPMRSSIHSECRSSSLLISRSSGFQACISRRLVNGRAAWRHLHTQNRFWKGRAPQIKETSFDKLGERKAFPTQIRPVFSAQTRCLQADSGRHDQRLQFEMTEEKIHCEDDAERTISGSIHLIVGPMFAGKTTALLKRVEAEASAGRRVALVKSDKDTRYGLASIVSHDGRKMPCWAVSSLASFKSQIGEEEYAKLDLIGIDEAQFLKDLYSFCQIAADYEGKTLIVAGLDGDFQRNKFGSILDLVPLADSVVKLSSHCEMCGKPASFTFRKIDNRNKEVIGGTDMYMPVCRQHYFSGKIAMEATRTILDTHRCTPLQFGSTEKPMHLRHENEC